MSNPVAPNFWGNTPGRQAKANIGQETKKQLSLLADWIVADRIRMSTDW